MDVKNGIIEDDTFLPVIFASDEEEDWEDPELWKRLNPSLGHIFEFEKIERDYKKAKNNPASAHNFKRFRCNMWVDNISAWLPMQDWSKCDGKVDYLDVSTLAENWLSDFVLPHGANINCNVDFLDMLVLAENWLAGVE